MKTHNVSDLFPVFDKRDGADCEHLQFKTWSEMGLPAYAYRERCISGFWKDHDTALSLLVAKCHKAGERIIAASMHNGAVSVAIYA